MMFGLAKPVSAAPLSAEADDVTTSDDVEAELATMPPTKPKPATKVIVRQGLIYGVVPFYVYINSNVCLQAPLLE
jgi:hypothetical protein